MPELVLDLLKFVFLFLLYIFVFRAVRAVYLELRPADARRPARQRSPAPAPARPPSRKQKKAPTKATVVEGSQNKGRTFQLGNEILIGRGEKCQLVLDDTYVSQMHARIFPKGDAVMIEDLGSTNGTYLNRQRITAATEVQRGDRVKIGKTVLEMRK